MLRRSVLPLIAVAATVAGAVGCASAPRAKGPDCTEAHVARADCHDEGKDCTSIVETHALCLARWPCGMRPGLDEHELDQVSRQVTPQVGGCVKTANARRKEPVAGELHVAFLVDGDGRVPYVQVMRTDVDAPSVTRCLLDAILGVRLAATGTTTTGQIPYYFSAPE